MADNSYATRARRRKEGMCARCGKSSEYYYRCEACRKKQHAPKVGRIGLSAQQNKVLAMRLEGRSFKVIAASMGIQEDTAESVYKLAKRADGYILTEAEVDALQRDWRLANTAAR